LSRGDIWLLVTLLVIAVLIFFFTETLIPISGDNLIIKSDDEVIHNIKLPHHGEINVSSDSGEVIIEIAGGRARIISSPCQNQICVRQGYIRPGSPPLVCLPERVIVDITAENKNYDALAR